MTLAPLLGVDPAVPLQAGRSAESIVSAIFVFVVSLIIGTLAIRTAAQILIDRDTGSRRALATALIGAVVYTLVGLFLGWIPILGPLLMLVAWVAVINWQYPGGWGTAIGMGATAWLIAIIILLGLAQIGIVTPEAIGIPGT